MKKGDLLFVYGTLRRGASADLGNKMGASFVSHDRINGRLYSVGSGWFPGVKTGGPEFHPDDSSVVGDVFLLNDDKIVNQLDAYEGYPSLYDRSVVRTEEGRDVWVYTYNPSVHSDSEIKGETGSVRSKPRCRLRPEGELLCLPRLPQSRRKPIRPWR
jgi:gamma-glutamylcyclotransferase (GGCT)/AIG2-like uncharacterized protein YtfP